MSFYRDLIYKNASVPGFVARNMDDVIEYVARLKGIGDDEALKIVRGSMDKGGTGSIVVDSLLGATKAVPGKRPVAIPKGTKFMDRVRMIKAEPEKYRREQPFKKPIEDAVWKMKSKIDDLDMRAGAVVGKKGNLFKQDLKINHGMQNGGEQSSTIKTTRLSAPLYKAKDAVVPLAGSMYLSSKLYPEEEGVDTVESN